MKTLQEYARNGHKFTLYARSGKIAIFHGKRNGGNSDTWEVIKIQSHNGGSRKFKSKDGTATDVEFLPAEYEPSNEQWGSMGWTYTNPEEARNRFEVEIGKEALKP